MKNLSLDQQTGYTLVEIAVIIAIIGLFTIALIGSGAQNVQVERFSGNLRDFADSFRQGQVASYSIKSGNCPSGECFWRGTLYEFRTNRRFYETYRLQGDDVSHFAANSDQRKGIHTKIFQEAVNLENKGLHIVDMGVGCDENQLNSSAGLEDSGCDDTITELSVAFLAPDGTTYTADTIYTNPGNPISSETIPFNNQTPVTLSVRSLETELAGYVTFDPKNANVKVQVK